MITVRALWACFLLLAFPQRLFVSFFSFLRSTGKKAVLIPHFYLGLYLGEILGFSVGSGVLG
jgi:hypothetical protein